MLPTFLKAHHRNKNLITIHKNAKAYQRDSLLIINNYEPPMAMSNILLASNSPILVRALTEMLSKIKRKGSKVQSVRTFEEMEAVLKTGSIQMLVLDFNIIASQDYLALEYLPKRHKDLRILFFCTGIDAKFYSELYRHGVLGIIKMDSPVTEIAKSLTRVYNGELYMENNMLLNLITEANSKNDRKAVYLFENLTSKEKLVAGLLVEGKANVEICELLNLHPSTVSTFKRKIFVKLNVNNLLELEELTKSLEE